jgi:hypothetical protein
VSAGGDTITGAITVGVTGGPARSDVSPWGAVTPWTASGAEDESVSSLDWFVAADDRWHVPGQEPTVRQRRIDGTPVVETRVRIPDGDAVQRVWTVPDHGGLTIVEVENDSPLAFAVAFAGLPVLTERPPADVPVEGISLPSEAIVLPVGHRASVRVGIAHARPPGGAAPPAGRLPDVAPALAVVRGWTRITDRASRLVLPDDALVEAVVAARADLLLLGPVDATEDPAGFVLDVAELVRCGDDVAAWLPEIVEPIERVARARDDERGAVLDAAALVAARSGDGRASGDIARLARRVGRGEAAAPTGLAAIRREGSAGRFVRGVESALVSGRALLPAGLPASWLGVNFEVHHVPTVGGADVSFAVRWHGERPAVLWEQHGGPVELRAPAVDPTWSSAEVSGEALWSAPRDVGGRRSTIPLSVDPDGGDVS